MSAPIRQFIAALLLAVSACASPLEEANAHFAAGDFAKAAAACEALIQSEGATAARLYNLGNARFRLNEFGPAILAYERAALLAPRDPDIRTNLKLARDAASVHDEVPPQSWWEQPLRWLSLHEWSVLTLTGAILAAAAVLIWGVSAVRRPWLKHTVIGSLGGGLLITAVGGIALRQRSSETSLAIVTAAKPVLRLSPFATADTAGACSTGRAVHPGERVNGWVHVTLRGSELQGWLPENAVTAIIPAS